jgi:predicted oxidoreductase
VREREQPHVDAFVQFAAAEVVGFGGGGVHS